MFDLFNKEDFKRSTSNDIIQQYQKNQEFVENFSNNNLIALQEQANISERVNQISNLQSMADKSDVRNKTNYITQNSNDLYSNSLETETIQRVDNEEMDIGEYWEMQQQAQAPEIEIGAEDAKDLSWGEWIWKHKLKFIAAGITIAAALVLYYRYKNKTEGSMSPNEGVPDVTKSPNKKVPDSGLIGSNGPMSMEEGLLDAIEQDTESLATGDLDIYDPGSVKADTERIITMTDPNARYPGDPGDGKYHPELAPPVLDFFAQGGVMLAKLVGKPGTD